MSRVLIVAFTTHAEGEDPLVAAFSVDQRYQLDGGGPILDAWAAAHETAAAQSARYVDWPGHSIRIYAHEAGARWDPEAWTYEYIGGECFINPRHRRGETFAAVA